MLLMYHVGKLIQSGGRGNSNPKNICLFSVCIQKLVCSSLMLLLNDFVSTHNSVDIDSVSQI